MNLLRTIPWFVSLLVLLPSTNAQDQYDQTFVVQEAAFHMPLDRLDPHREFWLPWDTIYRCVYETPLRCDPNSDILRLEPQLLQTLPTLDNDGILMRMQFRKDVKFNDDPCFPDGVGRKLTGHDFSYILKRHIDPRTRSPYYDSYLKGSLLGARRARAQALKDGYFDYDADIPGIKVIDDYRVELRFLRPYSRFGSLMTMTWLSLMPHEAVRKYGSGMGSHPVGTGPYLFKESTSDAEKLTFVRNPGYWNADAGKPKGPLPWNAGVTFSLIPELPIQEKRFANGDLSAIDLYPIQTERLLSSTGQLSRKLMPRGTRLMNAQDDKLSYIAFNMTNKILGKKKVRQALALALDRKSIVKTYFSGHGDVAEHLCPPAVPLEIKDDLSWRFGTQNLPKAKKILAEAGYPEGKDLPEFVLESTSQTDWERTLLEMIKKQWAKLGVKTQIRLQSYPDFLKRVRTGLPEISVNYWQADYPDPENFFMMLLRSSWPRADQNVDAANVGFYYNEQYERLYKKAQKHVQGKTRGGLFAKMIGIVQDDAPWVFLGHKRQVALTAKGVHGIYSRSRFSASFTRVWRKVSKRKR